MNRTTSMMVFGLILAFILVHSAYAQIESIAASVKATQGTAQLTPSGEQTPKPLNRGSIVNAWDTVATDEKSKLLLSWRNGLTTSMGEFSSLLLASEQAQAGVMPSIQVINGVFRFSSEPSGSSSSGYSVATPLATIYPASFDQPADFTVEVYDPKSTAITVLSGTLRVRKLNGEESTVPSCHSVSIEEGRDGLNAMTLSTADFAKLMDATTIPGTLVADVSPCAVVTEAPPLRQQAPVYGPAVAEYPSDYYVEDWDTIEMAPYFDVAVSPYEGGYAAFIPGIGRLVVEIPVYVEPAIVQVYLRTILWERCHVWYRDYLWDARHREGELRNLLYLARATGNNSLLFQTQRRLDDLAVRSNWAERRIDRLDKMGRTLEADQRKLSGKLPSGVNLKQVLSDSFYSRQNRQIDQKFQNRLKTSTEVETRLASLTGQEMAGLRDRIAKEPNMGKRLALAQELSQIKNDVTNGKLVIPKSQKQIAGLVDQIKKSPGAERQAQLENRLLTQIKAPRDSGRTADLVNQERLASLKNDLAKLPDPQGRKILGNRLTALEQSVQARRQAESNAELTRKKIDEVGKQVAREQSPAKRQELLGRINELSKTMTPGVPGTSQLLEKPKHGTTEAFERAKKEPSLKELEPRGQAEAKRQEQLKQQQAQKQELLRQQALEKEKRSQQARQEELRRQSALKQQEQLKQQQAQQQERLQQQALEKEKRSQQARQEELRRRSALKQQEQLKRQQAQQQLLRQQTLEREKRNQQARQEELRRQSALKQQQQLKRQQAQQQLLRQQTLDKERRSQQGRQEELRRQSALKQQQQLKQQQSQQQQLRQQQALQQQLRRQQGQQQQLRQQQAQQQALRQQQAQQQQLRQQRAQQQQLRQQQARPQIPGKPPQPGKGLPQFGQVEH